MPTRAFLSSVVVAAATLAASPALGAPQTLTAHAVDHPIRLDGQIDDWQGVAGTIVPLSGTGGADRVELRAAIRGDRIYLLAIWDDPSKATCTSPTGGMKPLIPTRRPRPWRTDSRSPCG